ncbi:hypothetical protein EHD93_21385 [Escherichia coli]|nr:hypothetical protein [Escherichia coli]EFO3756529.1 hypothetical protein [Escherichia coli]MGQ50466.1 hypothetical protein [Escherichia coli]HAJ7081669.1 hypothetical protein [Escherichia coli]
MRFVHAGCGVNALSGLQNHANSIYCTNHVGLISVAHQAVFSFVISLFFIRKTVREFASDWSLCRQQV